MAPARAGRLPIIRTGSSSILRGIAARAIEKARLSRNPVAIEPGRYTVILEPQAVGDLVQLMAFRPRLRATPTKDAARSPKQGGGNKIGEKIVDQRVTIFSDPQDPQLLGQPYDGQGLPLARQVWVENGVLKQLFYSRFWAQKQGKRPTGFPTSLKMAGGTTSMDDMIKSTPRGILVTRLWYLRQVDPRTILYHRPHSRRDVPYRERKDLEVDQELPVQRVAAVPAQQLEAIGPAVRLGGTEAGGAVVMPTIKAKDFNFTSLSDAV